MVDDREFYVSKAMNIYKTLSQCNNCNEMAKRYKLEFELFISFRSVERNYFCYITP